MVSSAPCATILASEMSGTRRCVGLERIEQWSTRAMSDFGVTGTPPARLSIGLISAGRVGTAVGAALERRGHVVSTVVGRSGRSRELAARRLPEAIGGDLPGVHVVRSLADVDRMAPEFRPGRRALIVGGGYIGLEAAAVAAKLGLDVSLVEMAPRILQRVAAPQTADYFRDLHHAHGVDIREGVGLGHLTGGEETLAHFADGTECRADFVITGIGIVPNDTLALEAGLTCDNGIVVDARGQTSDPHIWAAGDCARLPYRGQMIRLESVQNAIDQAEAVAANMLGKGQDYISKPWFWSDQYDVKLQIAGLNTGYDRVVIRPGANDASRSHWYFAGDELLAVDAMNDPRNYMIGKRLIEAGRSPDPALVADPGSDLKALLQP